MKLIFFFFILFGILQSCQYFVSDQFPDHDKRPTVNAVLVAGYPVLLNLSLSNKIDSSQMSYVENATIKLFKNNIFVELLDNAGNGKFVSEHSIEEGMNYSAKIIIPTFDTILVSTQVPKKTPVIKVEVIENAGITVYGKSYGGVKITFSNKPEKDNYYEVFVRFQNDNLNEKTFIENTDPVILNEGIPLALFSNEIIKDSIYTLQLNFHPNTYRITYPGYYRDAWFPFIVEFRSVSYDYYQFNKSYYLYERGRWGDGIFTPMGHNSLYSNVRNGFGIFSSYSVYETPIIDPEEGLIYE